MSRIKKVVNKLDAANMREYPGNVYKQVLTRNKYGQLTETIRRNRNKFYGYSADDETYAIPA